MGQPRPRLHLPPPHVSKPEFRNIAHASHILGGPRAAAALHTMTLKAMVRRWLGELNYPFRPVPRSGESFKFVMDHAGRHGNRIEVFKPRRDPGLLVVSSTCPFSARQRGVFLRLKAAGKRAFYRELREQFEDIPNLDRAYAGMEGAPDERGTLVAVIECVIFSPSELNKEDLRRRIVHITIAGDLLDEWIAGALDPRAYSLNPPSQDEDPRLRDGSSKMPVQGGV